MVDPPVGHNLEPRDKVIINGVVSQLDFGASSGEFMYSVKADGTVAIDGRVVTEISPFAFMTLNKSYITSIDIPSTVETIGIYAFADFENVKTATIQGSGLRNVEPGAFANCVSLSEINLPATTNNISSNAFVNCTSLTAVNVDTNNLMYTSIDGVVYTKDKSVLTLYPIGKSITDYTVVSECTIIDAYAFVGSSLTSVNLNNVISLRDQAFTDCKQLASIIGNNIMFVDLGALNGTAWLENELDQHKEFIALGKALYLYNGTAEDILIDDYVSVSPNAFLGNEGIKTVTIGNKTTTLGGFAFYGCTSLDNVFITNPFNTVYVGTGTFDGNADNRNIYVPYNLQQEYESNELWQQYETTMHQTILEYNLDGGTIEGEFATSIAYGEYLSLPMPIKENYYFLGWYTDESFNTAIADGQWLSYVDNAVLYAKWQPKTYTVAMYLNDGTQTIDTLNYVYGNTVELPIPTRTGYTFAVGLVTRR